MDRRYSVFLIFLVVLAVYLFAPLAVSQTCLPNGDINQDGNITSSDALLAFQHALGVADPPLNSCQLTLADVYPVPTVPDGRITASDALCIFQKALSLESCLDTILEPVANIDPDVPLFLFGDQVSEEQKETFRNTTYSIMHFFNDEYGLTLNINVTYYVFVDLESFLEAYREFHSGAEEEFFQWVHNTIEEERRITGRAAWGTFEGDAVFLLGAHIIENRRNLIHFVAHEHFHANQGANHPVPYWFVEGSARYVEALALEYFGEPLDGFTGTYSKQAEINYVRNSNQSLESIELFEDFFALDDSHVGYVLGRLGAEYLVDHYGGFEAIIKYYRSEAIWEDAFQDAFGISIDEFYEEFGEYQSNGFSN